MPIYSKRPGGPAGGSLSGSYPDPQVINLSGSATGSFSGSFIGNATSATTALTSSLLSSSVGDNIIDVSTTSAALRVTQRGSGNAILVEDAANPDGTPFVVSSDGRVGIGTQTPTGSALLHVVGDLMVSASSLPTGREGSKLKFYDENAKIYRSGSGGGNIVLSTSDIDRVTITSTGNVGIGTNIPAFSLDITNTGTARLANSTFRSTKPYAGITTSANSDSRYSGMNISNENTSYGAEFKVLTGDQTSSLKYGVNNPGFTGSSAAMGTGSDAYIELSNLPSGPGSDLWIANTTKSGSKGNIYFAVGTTEVSASTTPALFIQNDGKIGVGTNSPGATVDVVGNVNATSFTGSFSGSGANITNLTASNITNFQTNVRGQFSAGTNIGIANGIISVTGSTPGTVITSGSITGSGINGDAVRLTSTVSASIFSSSQAYYSTNILFGGQAAQPVTAEGAVYYDNVEHTLSYNTEIPNIHTHLGRHIFVRARNNTSNSTTLTKGTIVRITSSLGSQVCFERAQAVDIPLTGSAENQVIGMIADDITHNSNGYAVSYGIVENLNTSTLVEGSVIYLSSSAGLFTSTRPQAPTEIVIIGVCIYSHPSSGKIFIRPRDPVHFGDITGFNANTNLLDGQVIRYNSTNRTWENSNSGVKLTGSFSGSGANLDLFSTSGTAKGVVPGSNGSSSFFLKGDGTWSDIAASGYAYSATRIDDTKSGGEWLKLYSNKPNSYLYASGTLDITASSDLTVKTTSNLNLGDASTNNTYIKGGKLIDISALTVENTKISISTPTGSSAGVTSSIDLTTKYINLTASQKIFASSSNFFLNDKFQVTSSNFYVNESVGTAGFIVRTAGLTQISSSNLYLDNKQFKLEVDRYNIITDISASSFTASVTAPILFITGASPLGFTISGYNIALNKTGIYDGAEVKVVNNVIQSGLPSYSSSIKVENQTIPSSSYKSFILLDNYWYPSA